MNKSKTILVTGGHLTPALAVIDELRNRGYQIIYVGRVHALEGDTAVSAEYKAIKDLGLPFEKIIAGKLSRVFNWRGLVSFIKIPLGFYQAAAILRKHKPQAILSFGGYVAIPLVLMGKIFHIPMVTHEQTLSPGLANQVIARVADKICISWKETAAKFPQPKTILTGNPLRQEMFKANKKLDISLDKPLIYVTGGSLGAHRINEVTTKILPQLLADFSVVHQCGDAKQYNDIEKLQDLRSKLAPELQKRYLPITYVEKDYIGWVLNKAAVVVGRSGANTVWELVATQKPSILIPLPWSGMGEQLAHAQYLSDRGAAITVEQTALNEINLLAAIKEIFQKRSQFVQQLSLLKREFKADSAQRIADVVESVA